jgi:hypothetical protein
MRQHADLDQRIAGRAISHSRATFAFQAQNLTVPRARRDADVKRAAIGEDDNAIARRDRSTRKPWPTLAFLDR